MPSARPPDPAARAGLGLGPRIALLFAAAFVAIFAGLGLFARELVRAALAATADRVLEGELGEIEAKAEDLAGRPDFEAGLVRYVGEEAEDEQSFGLQYRIRAADGRVIAAAPDHAWHGVPATEPPRTGAPERRSFATIHPRADDADGPPTPKPPVLRLVSELRATRDGHRLLLEIGYDFGPAEAELARLTRLALLAVPVAVALAVLGGLLLARRALAPLREIEAFARRVSAQSAGERIPRTGRADEVDRLAATLNGMLDRLDGALEANARFAADAAHELRTPLQTLRADLDLARAAGPAAEPALARATAAADRLAALVRDLLTLARADHAEAAAPARERIALGPLLAELVEDLRPLGEERGVRLVGPLAAPAPVEVWGDRPALRRLFANLLENACLYADPGEVRVAVSSQEGRADATIEDGGPGIAPEEREQVFDRFHRGRLGRERNPSGTGLGLAICVAIARAHGGTIQAGVGAGGRGTTFRVSLVRADA